MKRPLNNADMFAERGDPWSGDIRRPLSRLEGVPSRLSGKAWKWMILRDHQPKTLAKVKAQPLDDYSLKGPDFDQIFAPKALPISLRLAKERNKIVPHGEQISTKDTDSGSPLSSSRLALAKALANARTRINARRASHLVKVK